MNWFLKTFTSSIGKKLLMALTGIFLIMFLVVHLSGNLQLIFGTAEGFNLYSRFMTTNPLIKTTSYLLYATFLLHIIVAIVLAIHNKKSRPVGYAVVNQAPGVKWSSRNMGILGTIILIFLVIHLANFWYEMKFGVLGTDSAGNLDLYLRVVTIFNEWWYVLLYVLAMIGLGFHLFHGFESAFWTFGWRHTKYSPIIKGVGRAFAIIVPFLFAIIPIYIFFQ